MSRPPAPLPTSSGGGVPPPRPEKPPDLLFTSSPEEVPPPPIPTRPAVSRSPIERKGFTTKVLPDPPPQTVRNVVKKTSGDPPRDLSYGNSYTTSNGSTEEGQQPPPLPGSTIKPPPLPKSISQDTDKRNETRNGSANSGNIFKMLNKFEKNTIDEPENKRPQLAARPQLNKPGLAAKPAAARPSWMKATGHQDMNTPLSPQNKQTMPSEDNVTSQVLQGPPRPTPRLRFQEQSENANFPVRDAKPTPPIPTKETSKIKKFVRKLVKHFIVVTLSLLNDANCQKKH